MPSRSTLVNGQTSCPTDGVSGAALRGWTVRRTRRDEPSGRRLAHGERRPPPEIVPFRHRSTAGRRNADFVWCNGLFDLDGAGHEFLASDVSQSTTASGVEYTVAQIRANTTARHTSRRHRPLATAASESIP